MQKPDDNNQIICYNKDNLGHFRTENRRSSLIFIKGGILMFKPADTELKMPNVPYTYILLLCLSDRFRTINIGLSFYHNADTSEYKIEFNQLPSPAKYRLDPIEAIIVPSLDDIELIEKLCTVYATQEEKYRIARTQHRRNKGRHQPHH